MKQTDILFKTDRFNLSKVEPHFINDICFGEDLGNWLRPKLESRGVTVTDFGQEDWGWMLFVTYQGKPYSLGIGGNSEEEENRPNLGQWRLVVMPGKSIKEIVFGSKSKENPLGDLLLEILKAEPDFSDVEVEP